MQFAASLSSEFTRKQARVCDNVVLEKPSRCPRKDQTPNPKHHRGARESTKLQTPSTKEAPIVKLQSELPRSHLNVGAWSFFGGWSLVLGISAAVPNRQALPVQTKIRSSKAAEKLFANGGVSLKLRASARAPAGQALRISACFLFNL